MFKLERRRSIGYSQGMDKKQQLEQAWALYGRAKFQMERAEAEAKRAVEQIMVLENLVASEQEVAPAEVEG